MENDDSFLEEEATIKSNDKKVLQNLTKMGEHLKELQLTMLQKQAEAEAAKKSYEHYAHTVMPLEMFACGVDSISLATGGKLTLKRNFYAQPNKNDDDRKKIIKWLRENGGDYIIENNAEVLDIASLKAHNIPFVEQSTVNTAKLKSFIKDKLGVTTGVQQIKVEDIPACIHFQEVTTVELEV